MSCSALPFGLLQPQAGVCGLGCRLAVLRRAAAAAAGVAVAWSWAAGRARALLPTPRWCTPHRLWSSPRFAPQAAAFRLSEGLSQEAQLLGQRAAAAAEKALEESRGSTGAPRRARRPGAGRASATRAARRRRSPRRAAGRRARASRHPPHPRPHPLLAPLSPRMQTCCCPRSSLEKRSRMPTWRRPRPAWRRRPGRTARRRSPT